MVPGITHQVSLNKINTGIRKVVIVQEVILIHLLPDVHNAPILPVQIDDGWLVGLVIKVD